MFLTVIRRRVTSSSRRISLTMTISAFMMVVVLAFPMLVSSFTGITSVNFRQHISSIYRHRRHPLLQERPIYPTTQARSTTLITRRQMSIMDDVQGFFKRFTQKASASHILLKGDGAQLANQLEDWKVEIDDSPIKFAEYATQYSQCPSSSQGGDLGEFGPGQMVQPFDQVVFDPSNDINVVHGPVKTQFGYHLIYIRDRTD